MPVFNDLGDRFNLAYEASLICQGEPFDNTVEFTEDGARFEESSNTPLSVTVLSLLGATYFYRRVDRPDWFELADQLWRDKILRDGGEIGL